MSLSTVLFSFQGRIPRSTYWYYFLAYMGLYVIALVIDSVLGTYDEENGIGLVSTLLSLVGLLTGLAVSVKRCHDRGRAGWFLFISLIPIIGSIWLWIELGFLRGTDGPNKYGSDPLTVSQGAIPQT